MSRLLYIALLLCSISGFTQASDTRDFDITFNLHNSDLKDTEFYFLAYRGAVNFEKCLYTAEAISPSMTKIRLQGRYGYILGVRGFLATICISHKYSRVPEMGTEHPIEEIQNYFINFDKTIGRGNEPFQIEIGDFKLENIPFIMVNNNNDNVTSTYSVYPAETIDYLKLEIPYWTKIKKSE